MSSKAKFPRKSPGHCCFPALFARHPLHGHNTVLTKCLPPQSIKTCEERTPRNISIIVHTHTHTLWEQDWSWGWREGPFSPGRWRSRATYNDSGRMGRRDGRRGNGLSRHRRKPHATGRRAPSRNATQRRRRTGGGARQKEEPGALRCTTARTSMRNPQYRTAGGTPPFQVVDMGPGNGSQEPHTIRFTPQHTRTQQRRPETHKRRRKTWVCEAHGHPPCRACALAHRGVRYCCARGHQGHPRVPAMCPPAAGRAPTPLRRLGARRASQRTPGRGEGGQPPAPKRRVTHTPVRGGGGHTPGAPGAQSQPHPWRTGTKRRRGETPPQGGPPGKRARRPERHGRAGTEVSEPPAARGSGLGEGDDTQGGPVQS